MIKSRNKMLFVVLFLIIVIIGGVIILNKNINRKANKNKTHFSGYGIQLKKENYAINDFTFNVEENGKFDCDIIFTIIQIKKVHFH